MTDSLVTSEIPPDHAQLPDLLPARMLNEFAYCARLGYLMWVQGEFADNVFTEDGKYQHRAVDREEDGLLPDPSEADGAPRKVRSVMLSAPEEGLIARIDLVESEGQSAVPVDYKRGKKPRLPEGAYEPERVQICAQAMVLRANGFDCDHGVLYFAGSKDRVDVPIEETLVTRTRELAAAFRQAAAAGKIPPPLADSPRCNGCSLVGICLPDETNVLAGGEEPETGEPRRLIPARDDALPVYVQAQGAYVGKDGDRLVVKEKGIKVAEARLFEVSQLNLLGNVQVTTQIVQEMCRRGIPITYASSGGWFYGMTLGPMHKNIELRLHQYRAVADSERALRLARRLVSAKVRNCRTMLRRNADGVPETILRGLKDMADRADAADSSGSLLGVEGNAARLYFQGFPEMLKRREVLQGFTFEGRNRRPPRDAVNVLLSLAYSLLAKEFTVVAMAAGFDPFLGFYHRPRYGRPSLALDLMEEFRPLVADSAVISAINNGVVTPADFVRVGKSVALKPNGRKRFIETYERRLEQLIRHPVFGYQISYRRVFDVQTRLLGRHLAGEIPDFPEFVTR